MRAAINKSRRSRALQYVKRTVDSEEYAARPSSCSATRKSTSLASVLQYVISMPLASALNSALRGAVAYILVQSSVSYCRLHGTRSAALRGALCV